MSGYYFIQAGIDKDPGRYRSAGAARRAITTEQLFGKYRLRTLRIKYQPVGKPATQVRIVELD